MDSKRHKIILVDDDRTNLTTVRDSLMDLYDVFTVSSGKKLLPLLEKVTPDLILMDIEMPEVTGYEMIKILKDSPDTATIPVIFLSALSDTESEVKGLDLGAVDYLFKPFSRKILRTRVKLHLLIEDQKKELKNYVDNLEEIVAQKTQAVFELQNTVLKTVADLVEHRDNITGGHIERTQSYLRILVKLLLNDGIYTDELLSWDINQFVMSSQLHDVGKISIKDEILLKPGILTKEEFEVMKTHAIAGATILRKIEEDSPDKDFLKHAELMAESHHENWDGTGYPHGLKGTDIPLQGRLMAIVDVYDALTNERTYKKAFSHEEAIRIIREETGKRFDPQIAETFLRHTEEFEKSALK